MKVVDTTGAGDAFMGGLSFGLLQGWDFERVGIVCERLRGICCTKVGARAMSKRDEVIAFIKAQAPKGAVHFNRLPRSVLREERAVLVASHIGSKSGNTVNVIARQIRKGSCSHRTIPARRS